MCYLISVSGRWRLAIRPSSGLCWVLLGFCRGGKRKPPSSFACGGHIKGIFGFAVSRILSTSLSPTDSGWMIIPLGPPLLTASSDLTRKLCTGRAFCASLFGLAPRRVWLFSLQRLPRFLPFPKSGSMPWTFSLFHCSSISKVFEALETGRALPFAPPYGVRTFLPCAPTDVPQSSTAIIHKTELPRVVTRLINQHKESSFRLSFWARSPNLKP